MNRPTPLSPLNGKVPPASFMDRNAFVSLGEGLSEPHQAVLIILVQRLVGADLVHLDRKKVRQ
jgi:hypothetical protein